MAAAEQKNVWLHGGQEDVSVVGGGAPPDYVKVSLRYFLGHCGKPRQIEFPP